MFTKVLKDLKEVEMSYEEIFDTNKYNIFTFLFILIFLNFIVILSILYNQYINYFCILYFL